MLLTNPCHASLLSTALGVRHECSGKLHYARLIFTTSGLIQAWISPRSAKPPFIVSGQEICNKFGVSNGCLFILYSFHLAFYNARTR